MHKKIDHKWAETCQAQSERFWSNGYFELLPCGPQDRDGGSKQETDMAVPARARSLADHAIATKSVD